MEKGEISSVISKVLSSEYLGVLGTCRFGNPHTSLVAFASTPDLKNIIFATTRSTRKFTNLKINPQVCILIDSRRNDVSDFRDAAAITVRGAAEEAVDREKEELLKIYLEKNPHLSDFVHSPDCAIVAIRVRKFDVATRFQNLDIMLMK